LPERWSPDFMKRKKVILGKSKELGVWRVDLDPFVGHGVLLMRRLSQDNRQNEACQRRHTTMPTPIYTLFRDAILAEQQVICSYDGRRRELCPHIIGTNKSGEEVVLAWQFAGESSGKLPQWRCLKLANVRNARARDGRWHEGGSHRTEQTCVSEIDLDINIHVRKRR
jgi:hypothetical protein